MNIGLLDGNSAARSEFSKSVFSVIMDAHKNSYFQNPFFPIILYSFSSLAQPETQSCLSIWNFGL